MGDNYPQFEVAEQDLRSHSQDGETPVPSPTHKMFGSKSEQPLLEESGRFKEEFRQTQEIHVKSSNIIEEDNEDEEELRDEVGEVVVMEVKPKT